MGKNDDDKKNKNHHHLYQSKPDRFEFCVIAKFCKTTFEWDNKFTFNVSHTFTVHIQ